MCGANMVEATHKKQRQPEGQMRQKLIAFQMSKFAEAKAEAGDRLHREGKHEKN
jgi:hypothetical protein